MTKTTQISPSKLCSLSPTHKGLSNNTKSVLKFSFNLVLI